MYDNLIVTPNFREHYKALNQTYFLWNLLYKCCWLHATATLPFRSFTFDIIYAYCQVEHRQSVLQYKVGQGQVFRSINNEISLLGLTYAFI